jgi:hypothetical protein
MILQNSSQDKLEPRFNSCAFTVMHDDRCGRSSFVECQGKDELYQWQTLGRYVQWFNVGAYGEDARVVGRMDEKGTTDTSKLSWYFRFEG